MFDSLKITTSYLSFYCFWFLNRSQSMKFVSCEPNRIRIFRCSCVKNFRESYVFHCLVIKVICLATACLLYHISFSLSSTFFKFFKVFRTLPDFGTVLLICDCRLCSSDSITLTRLLQVVKRFLKFLFSFRNLYELFLSNKQLFPTAQLI